VRTQPDADALEFAASVRELLGKAASSEALRAAWDSDDGRIPGLWQQLAEVGVLGLTVPEQYGGVGADLTAALPVLIETGRAAVPAPVVETITGAALLAAAGGDLADEWLDRVVAGDAVIAVGLGPGRLVSAAEWADVFLLRDGSGEVHAVPAADVGLDAADSVDRGIRLAEATWDERAARTINADADAAFDVAAVAVAAQLVGLAEAMLDMAVRYALQREQFGVAIGSFQAVKQQLADAYVATSFAKPVVASAAWSTARGLPARSRDASHAKYAAGRAARRAARTALQVHAGIGYTFEHDLHIWMKRVWTLTSLWGDDAWHRDRVASLVLDRVDDDTTVSDALLDFGA
jgi:alkylation response protein AidB-like acyl-CoA dehydrogenase